MAFWRKKTPITETAIPAVAPKPFRVGLDVMSRAHARKDAPTLFVMPLHPPRAVPADKSIQIAQDSAIGSSQDWANGQLAATYGDMWTEGLTFLGFAYLSELAQRPEYRVMSETIASEMTRAWIRFTSTSQDDDDKADRLAELKAECERLDVAGMFRRATEQDGFFGRGHIYIDTGDTKDEAELKKSIGNGRDKATQAKIGKGNLKALRTVEALWCYPTGYNSTNPLMDNWYRPDSWYVMNQMVHSSRIITLIGREVPDILKPTYSFGGLSMSQMAKPYVDNWLQTRQSVNDIISSFTTWVLETDLSSTVQADGDALFNRLALFNLLKNNQGVMAINKESEAFQNVSAPIAGLDALQAQAQEHMASVSRIPLVKLLGTSPHGLNATAEPEIRTFYDHIAAYQEKLYRRPLHRLLGIIMMSLWGEIDEDIGFEFEPLWALDELQASEVEKNRADTDQIYIDSGVISPEEVRAKLAADDQSGYTSLDVEDMPDLRAEEDGGLEPIGGRPDPAMTDPAAVKAADVAMDADFEEAKHPRAKNGQFGSGGSSGQITGKAKTAPKQKANTPAAPKPAVPSVKTSPAAYLAALHSQHLATPEARNAAAERIAEKVGATARVSAAKKRLEAITPSDKPVSEGGFVQPDGTWTPERAAIHKALLKEMFADDAIMRALPSDGEKPTMTILGGRGGSGKSWLTGDKGPVDASKTIVIDADHFKTRLPGYEGWNAAEFHEESSFLVDEAAKMAIAYGVNVVFDATLKSSSSATGRIAQFLSAGHDIEGHYMYASPETATERAMGRFVKGGPNGRFVPPEVIMANTDNEKNFDSVIPFLKKWSVYNNNNSGEGPVKVAGHDD